MRKGGTFVHRLLFEMYKNIISKGPLCPIRKGVFPFFLEINDTYFPPVPRMIVSSGIIKVLLKLILNGKPTGNRKFLNLIAYEFIAIYEK